MKSRYGHFEPVAPSLRWCVDGDEDCATLLESFSYIDVDGVRWEVPAGYDTDGASIPRFFWRAIGNPVQGRYRRAAIIHDYECDRKFVRPFWRVHYVFWEAMRAAGVGRIKAWLMWFAVRYFGPRW